MLTRLSTCILAFFLICFAGTGQAENGNTSCSGECDPADFPITVGSWGGKVRSGPGLEFEQVGSTYKGDVVILTEDSGIRANGYPWYAITYQNGKRGYQWGGLLCSGDWQKLELHDKCDWLLPGETAASNNPGRGEICNDKPCSQAAWPILAGSWGGKIRSGPGMSYDQVGSTHQGDTLLLIKNAGIMMNGYPWYKIETVYGIQGYQWGGLLCGPGWKYLNIYRQCDWLVDEADLEAVEGLNDSLG